MAYFPKYSTFLNLQKPYISRNLTKTAGVKIRGNYQYFGSF